MVMVSFCWKMNFLPSKIKKQIRFIDDVLEINDQSRCIILGHPVYGRGGSRIFIWGGGGGTTDFARARTCHKREAPSPLWPESRAHTRALAWAKKKLIKFRGGGGVCLLRPPLNPPQYGFKSGELNFV